MMRRLSGHTKESSQGVVGDRSRLLGRRSITFAVVVSVVFGSWIAILGAQITRSAATPQSKAPQIPSWQACQDVIQRALAEGKVVSAKSSDEAGSSAKAQQPSPRAPHPRERKKERDYRPGDLLSQSDVKTVFISLKDAGWSVPGAKQIVELALPDQDFLVKTLRSESGQRFMRQANKYELAFDWLDRLARLPYGKQTITDTLKVPDGYKLIEHYAKPSEKHNNLAEILPNDQNGRRPTGKDFDKPTGRIYTEEQLIERLKAVHHADLARRQASSDHSRSSALNVRAR
jgi:hypothetical protein